MQDRRLVRQFAMALFLAGVVGAAPAFANEIYSNLGSGDSYDSGSAYLIGQISIFNQVIGESFVPSANFQFTDAQLALYSGGGTSTAVYLESDNSGNPGSILDTLAEQSSVVGLPGSVVQFDCTTCLSLTAGTEYWIVAAAGNGQTEWAYNDTGDNSGVDYTYSGSATPGSWSKNSTATRGAFEVDGTPLTTTVPEPDSVALFGTGIAGLALIHRRNRAQTINRG